MNVIRYMLFFALVSVLMSAGCANRKNSTQGNTAWFTSLPEATELIRYERTPCFGTCPHFEFVLYASGKAEYNGRNFVERKGVHKGSIDPLRFAEVKAVADSIGYFGMDEVYDNKMVMDLPGITTVILSEDGPGRVMNRYQGPQSLNSLYLVLDRLIEDVQWSAVQSNQ